ncbi:hypothetical protein MXC99_11275 [Thauera aromatica]|uniref:hypothetical protein n=1 Tax=Thauera aromatica TaxID=59405 RepID=UPI001FFCCC4E|nr:hypothetical protein [Thauera aromatica]MCK2088752.1 hypothetical protein [Thauera aromatica]
MATANCTLVPEAPIAVEPGRYFVKAITAILAPRGEVQAGDLLLIDSAKSPEDGDLVLVDGARLEAFAHQVGVTGIAIQVHRFYC